MSEYVLGDLDPKMVRMSTAFAGGVGNTEQEMCGALSGGVMIIGAVFGRVSLVESYLPVFRLTTSYREQFASEMGATRCSTVHDRAHAEGGLGSCAMVVEKAVQILLELLDEQGEGK